MSVPNLTENVSFITNLDDKPTLSADDLKKTFDKGSETIKEYINDTLVPAINSGTVTIVNDLTTGGTTKAGSAEMIKKLNTEKQAKIGYGPTVPTLEVGQIYIQTFDD